MTAPAPIATPWRQWAKNNSLGVNFAWRAISAGRLKVRRVGKRMLVLDEDGLAFLRALPEGPAAMSANLKRTPRPPWPDAKGSQPKRQEVRGRSLGAGPPAALTTGGSTPVGVRRYAALPHGNRKLGLSPSSCSVDDAKGGDQDAP